MEGSATLTLIALILAATFAGAAVYINVAEHPARLRLDDRALLTEWKPAYKRGTLMQAPLAALSGLTGLAAWWGSGDPRLLAGGIAMLAIVAYTLTVILPLNNRLMATPPEAADAATRAGLNHWAMLHGGRSALGIAGTLLFASVLAGRL